MARAEFGPFGRAGAGPVAPSATVSSRHPGRVLGVFGSPESTELSEADRVFAISPRYKKPAKNCLRESHSSALERSADHTEARFVSEWASTMRGLAYGEVRSGGEKWP